MGSVQTLDVRRDGLRQPSLAERQEAAAAAKKELLQRHREKMNDAGFAERKAAREAVVAAREIRCGAQGRRGSTDSAGRGREGSQRSSRTRSPGSGARS